MLVGPPFIQSVSPKQFQAKFQKQNKVFSPRKGQEGGGGGGGRGGIQGARGERGRNGRPKHKKLRSVNGRPWSLMP